MVRSIYNALGVHILFPKIHNFIIACKKTAVLAHGGRQQAMLNLKLSC